jgi:hypothetical protein
VNKIWRCPTCDAGIRAPSRLRKIDVRRFCLTCSAKTGLLVERTIPSRDAERARTQLLRKEHEAKARERQAAKRTSHEQSERGQLEVFARKALKLEAFETVRDRVVTFKIRLAGVRPEVTQARSRVLADGTEVHDTVTYGGHRSAMSTGHAYGKRRFVVTAGTDAYDARTTILHEIAHCAAGYEGGPHGDSWRSVFASAIRELTGETPSGMTHHDLHTVATECVRRWLDRGGNWP